MKKMLCALLLGLMIAAIAMPITVYGSDRECNQSGTTLKAYVTATAHWTHTFSWTIDKSVDPDHWEFYPGESGRSTYTITVTKDGYTDAYYIDGVVSVTNDGGVATENLAITIKLKDGITPPKDLIATATVDVSSNPVLDPGETGTYPYTITIPSGYVHTGGTYKITAEVTITNHSGHLGTPSGPSPSETTTLPSSPTLINDVIHVNDDNVLNPSGQNWDWEFSSSGSVTYPEEFTWEYVGWFTNTATIIETGQYDTATVTVSCRETPTVPEFPFELPLMAMFGAIAAYMVRRIKLGKTC
jgi:hypothetical protein